MTTDSFWAAPMAPWLAADRDRSAAAPIGPAEPQSAFADPVVAGAAAPPPPAAPERQQAPEPQEPQENGDRTLIVTVQKSGVASIDGLLFGTAWDTRTHGGVYYSAPDAIADYGADYNSMQSLTGFRPFTDAQLAAVHFALNTGTYNQPREAFGFSVEGFTRLDIAFAGTSGNAAIRVANSGDTETAYAKYPSNGASGGDAFFGPSGDAPEAGNYDWHTILHELGHTLGLKHGHDTSRYGPLPAEENSSEFSVMTYASYIGETATGYKYGRTSAPQTFMINDIAALQWMYGIDFETRAGDDVYKWTPASGDTIINGGLAIDAAGKEIFLTIWDGGGTDTYDFSAYATDLEIDLWPGNWTDLGTQRAWLGGGPNDGFARGNIANAWNWNDARALIERAYGGAGDDVIYGNDAPNYILGNAGDDGILTGAGKDDGNAGPGADHVELEDGDDRFYGWTGNDDISGGAGSDRLIGDAGDDRLDGGAGDDRLYAGSGNDRLFGGAGADFIDGSGGADDITGGMGNDRLQGRGGADRYIFDPGSGADRIFGFEDDVDRMLIDPGFGFADAAAIVARASGTTLVLDLGGGASIALIGFLAGHAESDIRDDIVIA